MNRKQERKLGADKIITTYFKIYSEARNGVRHFFSNDEQARR
jgi:hypothetical protein